MLRQGGEFVELGATATWGEAQVAALRRDITYTGFRLHQFAEQDQGRFQALFRQLIADFERGDLKPLPYRIFPVEDTVHALRTMAQAKHIGKIVVSNCGHIPELERHSAPTISANCTYLLTGGLGGLGLKVATSLVAMGARHVVLMGRSGPNELAKKAITQMESTGAQIIAVQADVTRVEEVAGCLANLATRMPPIRGIVHAAGVLDDGLLAQQSWTRFEKVILPKIAGAWNLHTLTADEPLDFFVLFSSSAALLGGLGQGSYASANAFLDSLAHYRRSRGLTAVSINWGGWADVGMAANLAVPLQAHRAAQGLGGIKVELGLALLRYILNQDETNIAVLPVEWPKYLRQFPALPSFFSQLQLGKPHPTEKPHATLAVSDILSKRAGTSLEADDHRVLTQYIRSEVAQVSGAPEATLAVDRSLVELGIDSLMALELRNRINRDLQVNVPIVKFLEGASIEQLTDSLLKELQEGETENAEPLKLSSVRHQAAENSTREEDWEEGEV